MSVRRSSRNNKGVHSKRLDEIISISNEQQQKNSKPKTQSKKQQSKPKLTILSNDEIPNYIPIDGESVRCLVCGTTDLNYDENEDDTFGTMIECDTCNCWQHVKCMFGKNIPNNKLPEKYICDVCNPNDENYKNLQRKLSYSQYIALREPTKFKLKKVIQEENLNDDQHQDKDEDVEDDEEVVIDAGALDDKDDDYSESNKSKRSINDVDDVDDVDDDDDKLSGDEYDNKNNNKNNSQTQTPNQTHRKKTTKKLKTTNNPIKSPTIEKEKKSEYSLDSIRLKIIKNFQNKLIELIPKTNNEVILNGKTIGELATEWATILEGEIHKLYPNKIEQAKYNDKVRSLLINLKISHLIERVINGEFTIDQLPNLSIDDMRTPEEKKMAEEARQHALSQVVIKNDVNNLPKTRLTHRGEEIIGDQDYQFDINDKRIEEVEKIKEDKLKSEKKLELKSLSPPPVQQQQPQYLMNSNNLGEDDFASYNNNNNDHTLNDENYDDSSTNKCNNNFNEQTDHSLIDDETFDNILNDNSKNTSSKPLHSPSSPPAPPPPAPPSSSSIPSEIITDKPTTDIWEGILRINENAVNCSIDFVSSTSRNLPKKAIIDRAYSIVHDSAVNTNNEFTTKGRLDSRTADSYLDKITNTRDLYLFEIKPMEDSQFLFSKIWSFYHSVSKYGVIKNSLPYIKDSYLLALSREKVIDSEESAIVFGKFPPDIIIEHLQNDDKNDLKLYLLFVVQREVLVNLKSNNKPKSKDNKNMQNIRPVDQKNIERNYADQPKVEQKNGNEEQKGENEGEQGDEGDEDYDPALSMTLNKLTESNATKNNNSTTPELVLADLMQNLK
jgi:hypothetical protein